MEFKQDNYLPDLNRFFIERGTRDIQSVAEMMTTQICPYLLHVMIPYIVTLAHGGVFSWMAFDDPLSVVIQCPNPNNSVVCRLRRKSADKETALTAHVESVSGECRFFHFPGQNIDLPNYNDHEEDYGIFDAVFPWILYAGTIKESLRLPLNKPIHGNKNKEIFYFSYAGESRKILSAVSICSPGNKIRVNLNRCARRCRYHKFPWRDYYKLDMMAPKGLCVDLFHTAYPWCLMKLYESGGKAGNLAESCIINCPNAECTIQLVIKKRPFRYDKLLLKVAKIMHSLGKKVDLPLNHISMDIISGSDKCPQRHCAGQHFEFNLGLKRSMCGAAFDAIYPFLHLLLHGIKINEAMSSNFGGPYVQCPDVVSKNTYEVCAL